MGKGSTTKSFIGYPPPGGNMFAGDGQGAAKFTIAVPEAELEKASETYIAMIGKAFLVTFTPIDLTNEGGKNQHLKDLVENNASSLVE